MLLVPLKTLLVGALRRTFDAEYPDADFRGLRVGIEYEVTAQGWPGVMVDFNFVGPLSSIGVGHYEDETVDGATRTWTRWRFSGQVSLTVFALSSLERDRIFDQLVRVVAFGAQSSPLAEFRSYIEHNDWVAANINFDEVHPMGKGESPGTPWGTDDIIYEQTLALDLVGEFIGDDQSATLVPLSAVSVSAYREDEPIPDEPENVPGDPFAWQ